MRYLRPEYQNPNANIQDLLVEAEEEAAAVAKLPVFPKRLAQQSQEVRQLLRTAARPMTPGQVAKSFRGVRAERVEEPLEMMAEMGQVREVPELGGYAA